MLKNPRKKPSCGDLRGRCDARMRAYVKYACASALLASSYLIRNLIFFRGFYKFPFLYMMLFVLCAAGPLAQVKALRVGDHPTKTRLVLDMTGRTAFSYDLDNADHLLVIELSGLGGWNAPLHTPFPHNTRIAGYTASKGADGSLTLAIDLKAPVRLGFVGFLGAEKNVQDRLVFDLEGL